MKCADCKWFIKQGYEGKGFCRRFPPSAAPILTAFDGSYSPPPIVFEHYFCGEFSEKETGEK